MNCFGSRKKNMYTVNEDATGSADDKANDIKGKQNKENNEVESESNDQNDKDDGAQKEGNLQNGAQKKDKEKKKFKLLKKKEDENKKDKKSKKKGKISADENEKNKHADVKNEKKVETTGDATCKTAEHVDLSMSLNGEVSEVHAVSATPCHRLPTEDAESNEVQTKGDQTESPQAGIPEMNAESLKTEAQQVMQCVVEVTTADNPADGTDANSVADDNDEGEESAPSGENENSHEEAHCSEDAHEDGTSTQCNSEAPPTEGNQRLSHVRDEEQREPVDE